METFLLAIRIAALVGMGTATGYTIVQMRRLRQHYGYCPKSLQTVLWIGGLGFIVLAENFMIRLLELNHQWIALSVNAFFLYLSVALVRTSIGYYRSENEAHIARKVEDEILRKLNGHNE